MDVLAGLGIAGLVIGFVVVVVVVAVIVVARRYKVASPSEAFIVTGRKGKAVTNPETNEVTRDLSGQRVVMGGGVFVKPLTERVYSLSLSSRSIRVQIRGAVSQQGIRLNLDAVAIVKVGGTEDAVRAAAQRFLHQQDEIEAFTQEVLAGSLRAIVGTLTVDEIIRDRAAFARQVADESVTSLNNQGLVLDTFQIQDVSDDSNYLRDLGRPEAAAAARNAAIAEADAERESSQRAAKARELVAESERDLALRQAGFKADTDRAAAQAAAAGDMAKAEHDQEVLTAQERVAERQAQLTERKLDTEVRRPADAERYRREQEAQAQSNAEVFDAQGRAKRAELEGEADLARRRAQAEAVRIEGEAEAAAIEARGRAEADAQRLKAEAYERYGHAATASMVVDVLPKMAKELAAPISAIDDLTIISNDGASALSKSVGDNLRSTLEMVKRTTGIDVTELLKGVGNSEPVSTPVSGEVVPTPEPTQQ